MDALATVSNLDADIIRDTIHAQVQLSIFQSVHIILQALHADLNLVVRVELGVMGDVEAVVVSLAVVEDAIPVRQTPAPEAVGRRLAVVFL